MTRRDHPTPDDAEPRTVRVALACEISHTVSARGLNQREASEQLTRRHRQNSSMTRQTRPDCARNRSIVAARENRLRHHRRRGLTWRT